MPSSASDFASRRFSTASLPERQRLSFWRDFFGQEIVHCDIEVERDVSLRAEATLVALPELRAIWFSKDTPMRMTRTRAMVADGDDTFALLIRRRGRVTVSQRGLETVIGAGEAAGFLHAEPCEVRTTAAEYVAFVVPRKALALLVPDLAAAASKVIRANNEALRLLAAYGDLLRQARTRGSPELHHLAATHVQDLMAVALGATAKGTAVAADRGLRAARLQAVKADILVNLRDPALSVPAVALRQSVTPRYIHMLFEREGVTFSEFVLSLRLKLARRMLSDPRFADRTICAIAFEAGFGDLSHFNRMFRRRFGATPLELRVCGRK